jgi:hypothetical protein
MSVVVLIPNRQSTSNKSKLFTGSFALKWNVCMTRGKFIAVASELNIPRID